jgi:hypothetical protein
VAVRATAIIATLAAGRAATAEPLALRDGESWASLTAEVGRDGSGRYVVAIAPDVWVGVAPRVTVGVISSNASVDRVAAGGNDLGVDVRYALSSWVAPRLRVLARGADPRRPALTIGAVARWTHGRFAIRTDPYVRIGLIDRDAIVVPVWFEVQPTARLVVAAHTGWGADLQDALGAWHVPLAADVSARLGARWQLVTEAGFTSFVASQGARQARAVTIALAWNRDG